jgi:hypothetical protein
VNRFLAALASLLVTLWVGGLWIVGYLAVPVLFKGIPDSMLAGQVAGIMFSLLAWVGLGVGAFLLGLRCRSSGRGVIREPLAWVLAAMLVLTAVGQFGIQPLMVELKAQAWPRHVMDSAGADSFRLWHGVSSIMHLTLSVLGLVLVLRWGRERTPQV